MRTQKGREVEDREAKIKKKGEEKEERKGRRGREESCTDPNRKRMCRL